MAAGCGEAEAEESLFATSGGFVENGAVNFGSEEFGFGIGRGRRRGA